MKRLYHVRRTRAEQGLEMAADALTDIHREAEAFYACQGAAWQEGTAGQEYVDALKAVCHAVAVIQGLRLPDVEIFR